MAADHHFYPALKQARRLVRSGRLRGKRVVLFGAGVANTWLQSDLESCGIQIASVVDNDKTKVGTEFAGLKVGSPEEVLLPFGSDLVILVSSDRYYGEITYQLEQYGYRKGENIFVVAPEVGVRGRDICQQIRRSWRGAIAHWNLSRKNKSDVVFLFPYQGIGDTYVISLFFHNYLARHAITNYLVCVASSRAKRTAELFGIDHVVVRPRDTITAMIDYARLRRLDTWSTVVLHSTHADPTCQALEGYKGVTFEHMNRYCIFDFDDDVAIERPSSELRDTDVEQIFIENGLVGGRTLLIAPYANILDPVTDDEFWKRVVEHYRTLGFSVATNLGSMDERPLSGTVGVSIPIEKAVSFLDAAGYFIGVRSGFCDLVSESTAQKVILYDEGLKWRKASTYEFFSLKSMRLDEAAIEFECSRQSLDVTAERIFEALS